jgi:hypothetical protein
MDCRYVEMDKPGEDMGTALVCAWSYRRRYVYRLMGMEIAYSI